jgi:hypothetical protein
MKRDREGTLVKILPAAGGVGVVALTAIDSFLLDPFILFFSGFFWGMIWALLWKPRSFRRALPAGICIATVGLFWVISTSLYLNLDYVNWIVRLCKAESGRDWMLNSGVFHFDFTNPGTATHVIAALFLVTYPLWIALGALAGARVGRRDEGASSATAG